MHAKYEASISYGSKVIANVKVDNGQTNKQIDRTKTKCPRSFDILKVDFYVKAQKNKKN